MFDAMKNLVANIFFWIEIELMLFCYFDRDSIFAYILPTKHFFEMNLFISEYDIQSRSRNSFKFNYIC